MAIETKRTNQELFDMENAQSINNDDSNDSFKECASCLGDLTNDVSVTYQDNENSEWKECVFCKTCIDYMLETKWSDFMASLKKINCKAEFKRIVMSGPPINLRDNSIQCSNESKEVYKFKCDNEEFSAKLKDSFVGSVRDELCERLKEIFESLQSDSDSNLESDVDSVKTPSI